MFTDLTPERSRRLRGQILLLLRARHNVQASRYDDVGVTHALQSLAFEIGIGDAVTILQDLEGRGYVRYVQRHDSVTGRVYLEKIELTPAGRDQVEENRPRDPALEF
jgi:hypothetical protein